MAAHWDENPEAWDTCFLGGFRLPGVAQVSVKTERKIDRKPAVGKNGASLTDQGGHPGEVKITIQMTEKSDWDAWCKLEPILNPTKSKPAARVVVHPRTEAAGITAIVVEGIEGGMPENGILKIDLKCVEWFPATKKDTAKKKGGSTNLANAKGGANILDMARDGKVAGAAAAHDAKTGGQAGPPPPPSLSQNRP